MNKSLQPYLLYFFLTLVLLALHPTSTLAQALYKWKDSEGNWHFSDQPPDNPANPVEETQAAPINTLDSSTTVRSLEKALPSETPEEAAHRQRKEAQQQERQAALADFCQRARARLRIMEGPVVFLDAKGQPEKVSEKERAKRASVLRRQIESKCP